MSIKIRTEAHHEFLPPPSSQLFTLPQLPLPLASSPSLLPLLLTMPQSWLRVLVYDWVTLLCLWSSLSIFSSVPALPSICLLHLYEFTVCFLHALSCGVSSPLFISSSSFPLRWVPYFAALPVYLLPATAIIYLLSQSHIFSPAWCLTHWFCLILEHSHKKKLCSASQIS